MEKKNEQITEKFQKEIRGLQIELAELKKG